MPIFFDKEHSLFHLDSKNTSYVMSIDPHNYLLHLYYGAKIPVSDLNYLSYTIGQSTTSAIVSDDDEVYFSKDVARMEYACNGCGDMRQSALSILRSTGTTDTDIKYISHKIYKGKPEIPGLPATYGNEEEADTLEINCIDEVSGAEVILFYTVFNICGAMTRHVMVKNNSNSAMDVKRVMSTCVDFHDANDMDFIHLYGRHAKERLFERSHLIHGTQSVSSKRGASSHMQNPFVILCNKNADEDHGDVYGFNLVYSGNFLASAEMDSNGGARLIMGINPEDFSWHLEPGETFYSPEVVMVYSNNGFGGMSRTYHDLYRFNLCRGPWRTRKRPILINNWEATYFNFDENKLCDLGKAASELGIEMLVVDDGWFGDRNSDSSGLGDWFVNKSKLPNGLGNLSNRLKAKGLMLGIWFEPEMISPNSKLYEAHPDWAIHIPGRPMSIGRHQYVLDMTREDVRDYLYNSIKRILDSADIRYIKWDFNRNLTEVGSELLGVERQQEVFHRYVLGLYELLERIVKTYPELLIEGCAGGGGRFDAAWLYYAPQIWTSDDTDATERLDIQYGTSLCYPVSSMGAHVSVCPNHQTWRVSPFKTRGHIALSGTFGYELDLTKLSDEEKELVKEQCKDYHKYYDIIHYGDLYRLISPWEKRTRAAWSYVSKDKREVLVTYVVIRSDIRERYYFKLAGLDENLMYKNEETGEILSGAVLMNAGLCLQGQFHDIESKMLHFVAI